jgi:tetratricopeptide (TPR) repeat protein
VLHGLGGIGKTQLAFAYASRHSDDYSAVFWLNSKDVDTLKRGFLRIAKRIYLEHPSLTYLKYITEQGKLDEAVEAVKRWLSKPKNTRWLLIYDNYDKPELPRINDPDAFPIKPFLPEAHQGAIIITTRSSRLKIGHLIHVRKFQDIKDSLLVLSHTSGRQGLENSKQCTPLFLFVLLIQEIDPDAQELARRLDGLPLALASAGAYLYQVSTSFADYLRHYQDSWLRVQENTPQLLSYEDRALYTTWELSLNHVIRQNPLSEKLLRLWAYFDNQDVWLELLQACSGEGPEWLSELTQDQLWFDKALRVLCDHGLVERDSRSISESTESRGYSMHSCVHSWTIHVLNREWDSGMCRLALTCVADHVPSSTKPKFWVTQQRLIKHVDRCLGLIGDGIAGQADNVSMSDSMHNLGILYYDQGKLAEAEKMYQRALQGYEKALGAEHTSTLLAVNDLGAIYYVQGKLAEAEKMHQRALQGYEKALGAEHTSTLHAVHNLGLLYKTQGKLAEAEKMYRQVLQGYEKALGADHPSTLLTVNNLGSLYRDQGKLAEAEKMYQRALQGKEKALGADHTSTLDIVNNLGNLYHDKGKLAEAEKMYLRALQGYEKAFGYNQQRCQHLRRCLQCLRLQGREHLG